MAGVPGAPSDGVWGTPGREGEGTFDVCGGAGVGTGYRRGFVRGTDDEELPAAADGELREGPVRTRESVWAASLMEENSWLSA